MQTSRRRARKNLAASTVVKDQAIAYCKGLLPGVAQTLEGFFLIAGEPELAERVRTSTRRATQKPGEDEEVSDPASAGDSETGSTPAASSSDAA